jgi:hypothetical protein
MFMKPTFLRPSLLALVLLAAFVAQPSWALAGTSGGISGVVRDATSGAPIPGVQLEIASGSQSIKTTTDAHGHYVVFFLQPDDYTVTAEKDGYNSRSISGYTVSADQTQQYDLQLTPEKAQPPSN